MARSSRPATVLPVCRRTLGRRTALAVGLLLGALLGTGGPAWAPSAIGPARAAADVAAASQPGNPADPAPTPATQPAAPPQDSAQPLPTVTLRMVDAPLEAVLAELERQSGFVFVVLWYWLEAQDFVRTRPMSLAVRQMPLDEALDLLFLRWSASNWDRPSYEIRGQMVIIAPLTRLERGMRQMRVYDLRPLRSKQWAISHPPLPYMPYVRGSLVNRPLSDLVFRQRMLQLANLIQDTVASQADWGRYGGTIAWVHRFDGRLIIKAPPAMHGEVESLLTSLYDPGVPMAQLTSEAYHRLTEVPDWVPLVFGLQTTLPRQPPVNDLAWAREAVPPDSLMAHAGVYGSWLDHPFLAAANHPVSAFPLEVGTAGYADVWALLAEELLPPLDLVPVDEMINHHAAGDAGPPGPAEADAGAPVEADAGEPAPLTVHAEVAAAPWRREHRLLRLVVRGRDVPQGPRPSANLVFLVDVSEGKWLPNRLPLVEQAMQRLLRSLRPDDRVAIMSYGGPGEGLVLPPTTDRQMMIRALRRLDEGGPVSEAGGIKQSYWIAQRHFIDGGINRVILCTSGNLQPRFLDTIDRVELINLITANAAQGIQLSALGFGMDSGGAAALKELADHGQGQHGLIDSLNDAHPLLLQALGVTDTTVARDVSVRIEFNPARVAAYRRIGDVHPSSGAGLDPNVPGVAEIHSGHTVTALYELVPPAPKPALPPADDHHAEPAPAPALKYQRPAELTDAARSTDHLLTVTLAYRSPGADADPGPLQHLEIPVREEKTPWDEASAEFRFTAAVAGFGMLLRDSPFRGETTYPRVLDWARGAMGDEATAPTAWRRFVWLVEDAKRLAEPAGE